ncbi:matrix metalloproteinase-25 [Esox lucius]|uniref:matrix metalloproteinase-25 n=1 Tax=Esox lucius TaxID=8010 RepID=UPI000661D42E|nr:matrix metalloproteinase-25 [Esox lucius]XP_034148366.1 matrix metalloproteinase-25 [Esox lucius]
MFEYQLIWVTVTFNLFILMGEPAPMPEQYTRGLDWLSRYGYLPPPDPRTSKLQTKDGIEQAIRQMQRFGGLKETGILDEATINLMNTPRCSLPDIMGTEDMLKRRKRYALSGLRWDRTDLTWSVHSYPNPSLSSSVSHPEEVNRILNLALKAWSDAAPLSFRHLSGSDGDIRVSFSRSLHDDGYPFDGRGGTLAHAFFPGRDDIAGDTHFDDDEYWSNEGDSVTTDLFTVAVHEFGHALGLSHSSSVPSIMKPYYQGAVKDMSTYSLPLDDKMAIQELYGWKDTKPVQPGGGGKTTSSQPSMPNPPPPRPTKHLDPSIQDRCEGGFDAVANIRGEVFFFKGPHFWRIQRTGFLVSHNPALIKNFWIGLPTGTNKIDAVYERKSDNHIIFFIGAQYWVFKDTMALPGYPRPLAEWGMRTKDGREVERVEAAFVWAHNGKTYLFSVGEFWRFNEGNKEEGRKLEGGYPRKATLWGGVPTEPDDIISWGEGDAYFFKDNLYWVLKRGGLDQDNVTPKSIAVDWLKCQQVSTTTSLLPADPNPRGRDCSCSLSRASTTAVCSWLIYLSTMIVFNCFVLQ